MISSAVGNDARIGDMNFSDCPTIEPCFREQLLKQSVVANLDIANPKTEAFYERTGREGSGISMMQNPTHSRSATINPSHLDKLDIFEFNAIA